MPVVKKSLQRIRKNIYKNCPVKESEDIYMFRYTFVLIGIVVIAAGCASVRERQAFSVWQEESRKRVENDAGDVHLPELDENSTLDDYVLYALLNNPGLAAAFDRWKAALEKVAPARALLFVGRGGNHHPPRHSQTGRETFTSSGFSARGPLSLALFAVNFVVAVTVE